MIKRINDNAYFVFDYYENKRQITNYDPTVATQTLCVESSPSDIKDIPQEQEEIDKSGK
jgi:hypothetical protein